MFEHRGVKPTQNVPKSANCQVKIYDFFYTEGSKPRKNMPKPANFLVRKNENKYDQTLIFENQKMRNDIL